MEWYTIEMCPRCGGPIAPVMRNCTRGCGYEKPLTLPPLGRIKLPPLVIKMQLPIMGRIDLTPPAGVLVVDFPWSFTDKGKAGDRGAEQQYKVMSIDECKAFKLPPVTDDCAGFFWRVEALGKICYEVIEAHGFVTKSKLTWIKTTPCKKCDGQGFVEIGPSRNWCIECRGRGTKPVLGMGHYTRRATEDCVIAIRKGCKPGDCHPAVRNILDWFEAPRGIHSAKPDRFYEIVEQLYPDRVKCELFARRRREGWQQHGDELPEVSL